MLRNIEYLSRILNGAELMWISRKKLAKYSKLAMVIAVVISVAVGCKDDSAGPRKPAEVECSNIIAQALTVLDADETEIVAYRSGSQKLYAIDNEAKKEILDLLSSAAPAPSAIHGGRFSTIGGIGIIVEDRDDDIDIELGVGGRLVYDGCEFKIHETNALFSLFRTATAISE